MIILGDRYTFSKIEIERLKRKFRTITQISYKNSTSQDSINSLKKLLEDQTNILIVLNTQAKLPYELLTYLTKLNSSGIKYITLEHFLEIYLNKCYIDLNVNTNAFLEDIHDYSTTQYFQKRFIDYIAVLFLLPITLGSTLITWYKIQKESPGSLFFKQKRIGKGEEEFFCIKLRSMHTDAEKDGAKFASENDPRTFPWGNIIRYTKIDELMQLWNILKGEMHFVGPRPERKVWTSEFEKEIPYYAKRHTVRPGITGLAQIKYQYGAGKLDAKEKLMYDLYYIKNWNIFLELKIIWNTVIFVLTKKRKDLSNF
jgi:lipopolysaccharide/colanic/teichoic acid biosynthesis glycosyltransferase